MDVHGNSSNEYETRRRLDFEEINGLGASVEIGMVNTEENEMNDHMDTDTHTMKSIHEIHNHIDKDLIPQIGMKFETEDVAYRFYLAYAKAAGFGARIFKAHKDKYTGKICDRIFCCSKEGSRKKDVRDAVVKSHRPITRCNCNAHIKISCRQTDEYQMDGYRIVRFVADHNHDCVTPSKSHLFRSHRKMSNAQKAEVDMAISCGIAPSETMEFMSKQVGGPEYLGFIYDDCKNYLRSRRTIAMRPGDTGGVLEYLQKMQVEDPNFVYAIQVDADALITNIFWADAKMKCDYFHFGDVVCFDTTYRKNKEGRPIALFVGVNNHKQTIIFGAALLYDETANTFSWLFDIFATTMLGKKPQTILTDQDAAMAKALACQWPNTYHRLCVWHIYQNAAIHLSGVFAEYKDFAKDFSCCIYDHDEEGEFLDSWNKMIEKYGLQHNDWLERMFQMRKKWALVYGRETFCADMSTTQRSESMNSVIKKYVSYKTGLLQFFEHFERLLKDRRYKESRADFRTSQGAPNLSFPVQILKHAAKIYTLEIFELFQTELCRAHDCNLEVYSENDSQAEFKVTSYGKHKHQLVTYNSLDNSLKCSCKKYEFVGILCSHALKVLNSKNITRIPDQYIKKRWVKTAKKCDVIIFDKDISHEDPMDMMSFRYKGLCQLFSQLCTRSAESEKAYKIAKQGLWKLFEQVDASFEESSIEEPKSTMVDVDVYFSEHVDIIQYGDINGKKARGIKLKEKITYKTSARPKSALEKAIKKRKSTTRVSNADPNLALH